MDHSNDRSPRLLTIKDICKIKMTSFAITVHGQCCRRHVVGQQVVSDISKFVVVEVFVACVLNVIIVI